MKAEAVKKINTMGKVGSILAIIANVCVAVGILGVIAVMVVTAVIPKGCAVVKTEGTFDVDLDLAAVDRVLSDEEQARINALSTAGDRIAINGEEMAQLTAEATATAVKVTADSKTLTLDIHDLSRYLWPALLALVAMEVTFIFALRLCNAFKRCISPFEENVIAKMKALAWSLLPWIVLPAFAESALTNLLSGGFRWNFSLDLTMIVTVLIVFVLVRIFQYGAILQQESDETL